MFKLIILFSAMVAVSFAVVSGDYGSVGVQTQQDLRVSKFQFINFLIYSMNSFFHSKGALNTLSSYSKAVNTAHSQAFVSRTDYTSNPGIIAHGVVGNLI